MLNESMINDQNSNPENSHIVRYESIIIDAIHSQGFLFEEFNMSESRRTAEDRLNPAPLCGCGCGNHVKWNSNYQDWNQYIYCHFWIGRKHKEDVKQKISKSRTGNIPWNKGKTGIYSKEHIEKLSKAHKGNQYAKGAKRSLSTREKISKANTGKKIHSEEWKKKKSERMLGNKYALGFKQNTDQRKAMSERAAKKVGPLHPLFGKKGKDNPNYGRKVSEEQKKNQSNYMLNGGAVKALLGIKSPSKPQLELFEKVKLLFHQIQLNYPSLNRIIDIAIPDLMIAIEYDGSYWHQDEKADKRRQKQLERIGWKFIRYKDYVPKLEELKKDIGEIICKKL